MVSNCKEEVSNCKDAVVSNCKDAVVSNCKEEVSNYKGEVEVVGEDVPISIWHQSRSSRERD